LIKAFHDHHQKELSFIIYLIISVLSKNIDHFTHKNKYSFYEKQPNLYHFFNYFSSESEVQDLISLNAHFLLARCLDIELDNKVKERNQFELVLG
jgi:hypothetical protein